jgi:SAM-dependent methyltransferase
MTLERVDTDYQLEHFLQGALLPDRAYLYQRISDATVETVGDGSPGRAVDVGSGSARELARLALLGWETYAVDPSVPMLGIARLTCRELQADVRLVRAIGERLPFADASVDVVACQGALDHFADRFAFMSEAARVIRPGGRVVILLHNFEGVATKIGRLLHPFARATRLHHCSEWPCWQIPPDHTFKGDWSTVRALGGSSLRLERAYGISMLCQVYGWGHLLGRLPSGLSTRLLRALDRVAYARPSWSDVIVSVWRPAAS